MAVEAFIFVKNNKTITIDDKTWHLLVTLQLALFSLRQALFENQAIQKQLPLLLAVNINKMMTNVECPASIIQSIQDSLMDFSSLLWISLTGKEDICSENAKDLLHFSILHHLKQYYNHTFTIMDLGYQSIFSLQDFSRILQFTMGKNTTLFTPLVIDYLLMTILSLNKESKLLESVPSPRKEYCIAIYCNNQVNETSHFPFLLQFSL